MRMRRNILLKIFTIIISIVLAFNLNFVYAQESYENVEISEEISEQENKGEEISDEETPEQEDDDSADIPIEVSIDAGEMRFDYIEGYEDKEGEWKISGNTIEFINYSSDYTYNINIELNMNSYYSDFFTVSEESFNISPGEEKIVTIMLKDDLIEDFSEKNAGKAGNINISISVIDELT